MNVQEKNKMRRTINALLKECKAKLANDMLEDFDESSDEFTDVIGFVMIHVDGKLKPAQITMKTTHNKEEWL